jgi:hypothetical protein
MVADLTGRSVRTSFLIETPGASWRCRLIASAALAITRYLTGQTGVSIKKLVRTLRPLHSVTIDIGGHQFTAETTPTPEATEILDKIPSTRGY